MQSILELKDDELTHKAYSALEENKFVKGPYLEATLPFAQGKTLMDLIKENIACKEFTKIAESVEINRPLYVHQEKAFRKVVTNHRNLIVSTGTGSGKTECFVYPILNELVGKYLKRKAERWSSSASFISNECSGKRSDEETSWTP